MFPNKLNPIFFGFFISMAIKVTLFHASLLKIEPTIEAAIAPSTATPITDVISVSVAIFFMGPGIRPPRATHLVSQQELNTMRPNKESNLVTVKVA